MAVAKSAPAKTTAAPEVPLFRIYQDLNLPAGRYVRASNRRISTAYLEISEDGDTTYTNRRGETNPITLTEFRTRYLAGMRTPASEAQREAGITRAPRAN